MPNYRNQLPTEKTNMGFRILRTPQTTALTGIVTSPGLLVCDTHFWHGRTSPCERIVGPDGATLDDSVCSACQNKQAYRDHVYVSAFDPKTPSHFLFECTCHAAKPFAEHIEAHGTLRGCCFHATRPKQTPNGRVVILTTTATLTKTVLPAAPNVELALAVIWRLPLTGFALTDQRPGRRSATTKPDRMAEMRNQPDNAADPAGIADVVAEIQRRTNGQKAKA